MALNYLAKADLEFLIFSLSLPKCLDYKGVYTVMLGLRQGSVLTIVAFHSKRKYENTLFACWVLTLSFYILVLLFIPKAVCTQHYDGPAPRFISLSI